MTRTRTHLSPARLLRAAALLGQAPAFRPLARTVAPITGPVTGIADEATHGHLVAVGERAKVPAASAVA